MNTFEERLARLEAIAEQLRNGEVPIDTATALFEEGMNLSRELEKELRGVEHKIEILTSPVENGDEPPAFEDFATD